MKGGALFSTINASNLLCAFLDKNCTDSTRKLHGAQPLAFPLPQPCHASKLDPILLLLPVSQQTGRSQW